jgi:hypothetical protein
VDLIVRPSSALMVMSPTTIRSVGQLAGRVSDTFWVMVEIQVRAIAPSLRKSPQATWLAFRLLARAQTMGFLPETEARVNLNRALLASIADRLEQNGIAAGSAAQIRSANHVHLVEALKATVDAVDASPHPAGEWEPARTLLGDELLAELVGGTSLSSLRRYASGERATPDEIAWRLHVVARLLASLTGSYNDYGIRRWFQRRRTALDDATPIEVVTGAPDEDDPRLQRLLALSDDLLGAGSAA